MKKFLKFLMFSFFAAIALALFVFSFIGIFKEGTKTYILSQTYTGSCGPVLFEKAKLQFSLYRGVIEIELEDGTKVGISNVPCLFLEDK